jgi:hypothetical protein
MTNSRRFSTIFLTWAVLLASSTANADKMEIKFSEIGNAMIKAMAPTPVVQAACDAFEKIYPHEDGYRGCIQGTGTSMTLLMTKTNYSQKLWTKMVTAGDADYEGSVAYFYYNNLYTNNYKPFGSLILSQAGPTSATYPVQGGKAQFIIGYMVAMSKLCELNLSTVLLTSHTVHVKPTSLDRKTRKGNTIEYHFKVNGGDGTDILGIKVGISAGARPIKYRCEAAIYVEYGDEA